MKISKGEALACMLRNLGGTQPSWLRCGFWPYVSTQRHCSLLPFLTSNGGSIGVPRRKFAFVDEVFHEKVHRNETTHHPAGKRYQNPNNFGRDPSLSSLPVETEDKTARNFLPSYTSTTCKHITATSTHKRRNRASLSIHASRNEVSKCTSATTV